MAETKAVIGTGPAGLLGVAFVVLKLLGTIDWPWLWVLAPFWIPLALFVIVLIVMLGALVVAAVMEK